MKYFVSWYDAGCNCGCTPSRSGVEEYDTIKDAEKELFYHWMEDECAEIIKGDILPYDKNTNLSYLKLIDDKEKKKRTELKKEAQKKKKAEREKERREFKRLQKKFTN